VLCAVGVVLYGIIYHLGVACLRLAGINRTLIARGTDLTWLSSRFPDFPFRKWRAQTLPSRDKLSQVNKESNNSRTNVSYITHAVRVIEVLQM